MPDNFNSQQFCNWLREMDISHEEAAKLLKTNVKTIEGYLLGFPTVTIKHSGRCRHLLYKKKRLKESMELQSTDF